MLELCKTRASFRGSFINFKVWSHWRVEQNASISESFTMKKCLVF